MWNALGLCAPCGKPVIIFLQMWPVSLNCSGCSGKGNSCSSLLLGENFNLF